MSHFGLRPAEDDTHHVEPVDISRAVKPAHPVTGSLCHLPLLSPMHGAQRPAVSGGNPRLDFDEGNYPSLARSGRLGDEIDVTMSAPKSPVHNRPPSRYQPSFGNALTALSEDLTSREHRVNVAMKVRAEAPVGRACNRYAAAVAMPQPLRQVILPGPADPVEIVQAGQNIPRLRAVGGAKYSGRLQLVDYPRGAAVTDSEPPLKQ